MPQLYDLETTSPKRSERLWPLDLALTSMGITLLWIVLKYLRFDDPRLVYNAWTYLLLVPTALIVMSLLFRYLLGRFVERSMQLAFLISVTVHLMLMLMAANYIILGTWWPDVFEAISYQPPTPQKNVATNYFSITSPKSRTKPDYLKPAQTKHEATEETPTPDAMLELAKSEQANLASIAPDLTKSAQPSLVPKSQITPTAPQRSLDEAKRSRSESQERDRPSPQVDLPDLVPERAAAEPPQLAASEATPEKVNAPSAYAASPAAGPELPQPEMVPPSATKPTRPSPTLSRATENIEATPTDAPPLQSMARASNSSAVRPNTQIEIPTAPTPQSENTTTAPRSDTEMQRSRASTTATQLSNALANNLPPRPQASMAPSDIRRRELPSGLPDITPGDAAEQPRQKSAGGATDATPVASLPTTGPLTLPSSSQAAAAEGLTPTLESAISSQQSIARRASQSAASNMAMSPLSNPQEIRPSAGQNGSGLQKVPANQLRGNAISIDSASLAGADREPLTRSALDQRAPGGGSADVPKPSMGSSDKIAQSEPSDDPDGGKGEADALAPSESANEGRSSPTGNLASSQSLSAVLGPTSELTSPNPGKTISPSLSKATRDALAEIPSAGKGENNPRTRSESSIGPPSTAIAVDTAPGNQSGGSKENSPNPADSLTPSDSSDDVRPDSSTASNGLALNIDAALGPGGISATGLASSSSIMARPVPNTLPTSQELLTQRFLKKDAGGPLSGGSNVPIPKPAFQQRVDRAAQTNEQSDPGPLGPETEEAIERGLQFLVRNQRPDGSWRLQDFDTKVLIRSDTAATALALLSFQGAGYTHKQHKYAEVVAKALAFLVSKQKENGDLYIPQDPASDQNAWLYSHSIASLALCEAYGMTQDAELKAPAQKAVDFMVSAQDPERGGWRYRPGRGADTSVTGWFMMALQSARLSGLEVPDSTNVGITKWLAMSQASEEDSHLYRYNPKASDTPSQRHGLIPNPTMTSVGLLIRLYTGWKRDHPDMIQGSDYLMDYLPQAGTSERPMRDTYYWYYATQVLFHMGGEHWEKWNGKLHPLLLKSQVLEGKNAGSWEPLGEVPDLWGKYGGRLYVTTLNLLSLEVYYRHLPLYDATAK